MTIAIFGNTGKRETIEEVNRLLAFMQPHGVRILLSAELRNELNVKQTMEGKSIREDYPLYTPDTTEDIDFALSIGGDGTFLTTAMQVVQKDIPILGINCGHLGFLADVQTDDADRIMQKLLAHEYTIEERSILQITALNSPPETGGVAVRPREWIPASYSPRSLPNPLALNEIAILKQELASMISVETLLNGEPLHTYHGDGLIISTPTGSTAYNLSAGGPISVPQADVLLLSPVASHSLSVRPLIIPDDWKLDLRVHSRTGAYLISIDGRSQRLTDEIVLHVEKAARTVKLVRFPEQSFINTLKSKLNWGI